MNGPRLHSGGAAFSFITPMKTKLIAALAGTVLALILLRSLVSVHTVAGNEVGVKETWGAGVAPDPLLPRTYVFIPGFATKVYDYDMSSQVFVMNNIPSHTEKTYRGRETDAYKVQSEEGQDMTISLNVQWRLDPLKVVELHKTVRKEVEEKVLRPTVMRVVKDAATKRKAIEAYSGVGLVTLQKEIQDALTSPESELRHRGVIVTNFVVEGIMLDPEYIGQIKARQVATQKKLTADEEQKAAEAVALRAKSEAQADYNKQLVEAERDKAVGILNAEKLAQQQTLAAEADAKKQVVAAEAQKQVAVLNATGEQQASELKARAILALGQSEAESQRLKLSAYAVPGAEAFVRIEVAKGIGSAFSNIKGFLPADMKFNVLTESMEKSVNVLMGGDHPAGGGGMTLGVPVANPATLGNGSAAARR